jgi:preprotein translocase subunit YajC
MFWNLLTEGTEGNPIPTYVMIGVIIVLFVVMFIFNSRSQKKRQKEQEEILNAVKPGSKVKTIGGICGIVAEVNAEEGTFVLETGSESTGKCFIKFDRQAIYQTDAKKEDPAKEKVDETPAEVVDETPAEEKADE